MESVCDYGGFDWEHLVQVARRIARSLAAKWVVAEADDIQQEMLRHVLEQWEDLAPGVRDDDDLMARVLYTAGERYAVRERDYRDLTDGVYYYTPNEARHALRQLSHGPEGFGHGLGRRDNLNHCEITDNIHTACLEAKIGLEKINPRYRELLVKHFVMGVPCHDKTEQKACQRGAVALSREMNRSLRRRKTNP